jgi:hypothetical protein
VIGTLTYRGKLKATRRYVRYILPFVLVGLSCSFFRLVGSSFGAVDFWRLPPFLSKGEGRTVLFGFAGAVIFSVSARIRWPSATGVQQGAAAVTGAAIGILSSLLMRFTRV